MAQSRTLTCSFKQYAVILPSIPPDVEQRAGTGLLATVEVGNHVGKETTHAHPWRVSALVSFTKRKHSHPTYASKVAQINRASGTKCHSLLREWQLFLDQYTYCLLNTLTYCELEIRLFLFRGSWRPENHFKDLYGIKRWRKARADKSGSTTSW